ncbi:hypothetical protein L211DRAFT_842355 [Terfezia boudieri ATCC MYA-4762]|uniref:Uncharacterized protein n=1 Tax=Terfezia boudieri ATCC MYA-4762 TaxID=1051890 RepID=A0A3N4LE52_9PEZI|nr:hypothetical protein L211DRAFT_842355 [Terfezia boudieri ATCC MYA-4762]
MSGKKRGCASPEADPKNEPNRKVTRYQESYPIAGPSTPVPNTTRLQSARVPIPAQQLRPVLPKPRPAVTHAEENVRVNDDPPVTRMIDNQEPQTPQPHTELLPCTMTSQDTLVGGSGVTPHTLRADTSGSINLQGNSNFGSTTITHGVAFQQTMLATPSSADTVMRAQGTSLNLFSQISPYAFTPWGYCFSCDNLWRNHRESMIGLLRSPGVRSGDNEMDSTPVTCNIFSSYFAFQDHVARCHGWSLGG